MLNWINNIDSHLIFFVEIILTVKKSSKYLSCRLKDNIFIIETSLLILTIFTLQKNNFHFFSLFIRLSQSNVKKRHKFALSKLLK